MTRTPTGLCEAFLEVAIWLAIADLDPDVSLDWVFDLLSALGTLAYALGGRC